MNDVRYRDVFIRVNKNPVIIVGQNPGNQRKGTYNGECWNGNKSADLLNLTIEGQKNVVLTNICQYKNMNSEYLREGIDDFNCLINELKPKRVIVLGNFSMRVIDSASKRKEVKTSFTVGFYKKQHPSYIVRFGKDKQKWMEELRYLL